MNYENFIQFADDEHKRFFLEKSKKLKPDVYLSSLIYTLGVCNDTRRKFDNIFDSYERVIIPNAISQPWQTGTSLKVTRLAFQLFTDRTPTAFINGNDDIYECMKYSVSDIFCCCFAPFFFYAIKIRYWHYF
ncbi:MAG: DUF6075 family protein [Oscillospiraceae bacterium]|jgi:hypothetical protein|nr:DUF6075 family protein [Oscillospiraceae bacterium]